MSRPYVFEMLMKILISGASGFIGSHLVQTLRSKNHEVSKLVRKKDKLSKDDFFWDPVQEKINPTDLEAFDIVINLAGESVVGRWSDEKKRKIRDSRVLGTRFLANTLSSLKNPPQTFLCASAIGFYGNRGDELLNENSQAGKGFLANVCQEWESASQSLSKSGTRVIHYRIGIVLSKEGGALQKMILPFKMGVGGKLGNGKQWMSWISLEDLLDGILFCIENSRISGPVNAVAPHPVRNEEFTKVLGKVLHRPTLFAVPEFALKLAMGEMAEEVLLASAKVKPEKLLKAGFQFKDSELFKTLSSIAS